MMRYAISTIFGLLSVSCSGSDVCKSSPCIGVDVYYVSLCPYSAKFIKDQLMPSYPDLKNYLDVKFIPYGKAKYKMNGSNKYEFECQHGPNECIANKAQICGYEAILNSNKTFEDKKSSAVELVGCAMSSANPVTAVPGCAKSMGLSAEIRKNMTDCMNSEMGDRLLAAYGDKTYALTPTVQATGIPAVVIDHVYSPENHNAAIDNFKNLICNRISEGKPTICSKESNGIINVQ
ncbi:gamma-interferon-inducible lysosomal thiol reductase-like [Fopius arisanus]|uniref:Gamma-interferon-inducible lysosomal thiol reductase-like n=1 Tax=Fopius arisanus TaxID=64838 RepID=A0A9R1TKE3_9HYME|nr:PREDICTED: gamma-interferon-inducible lysosomal thiol reductase-like [Fopius arisanus]